MFKSKWYWIAVAVFCLAFLAASIIFQDSFLFNLILLAVGFFSVIHMFLCSR